MLKHRRRQDPRIRLKTILSETIEALEDIGPYGTCVFMEDVIERAKNAATHAREMLAEYEQEYPDPYKSILSKEQTNAK